MLDRIHLAQFDPAPGDIAGNSATMVDLMARAEAQGAALVVFPEECISGYCVGDLNRSEMLIHESLAALEQRIAPASGKTAAVVGLVAPAPGRHLNDGAPGAENAYAVVQQGALLGRGAKALLVDDGVFYDSRYFLPAAATDLAPVTITTEAGPLPVGVMVCHDMWDDFSALKPARILAERGAKLLVVINSSPYFVGRLEERLATARRRVLETGVPLAYVNSCSVQDNGKNVILFDGGSFVLDARGATVARAPQFNAGLYSGMAALPPDPTRAGELLSALRFGVKGFFARTGVSGAVIGLSGGIDSALSAALLVDALGPAHVLGLNMPTRFSSQTTQGNARELATRLGIEYVVHPIEDTVSQKAREYRRVTGHNMGQLSFENVQARERGNVLMTYAQERGRLVVGNGNKTEFQRGYATMYGDILGAFMPLGDLAKTDVYRVADEVNRVLSGPIPESIITIPPSAELSAEQDIDKGQGDPFDYDVEGPMGQELIEFERTPRQLRRRFEEGRLDPVLWAPVRSSVSVYDKFDGAGFEALAWEIFGSIEATVFKRIQAPPVLKVSRKAFGFDLREAGFARLRVQSTRNGSSSSSAGA
jgi:NAD+ synthase (glutamine-hydrolysing)